MQNKFSGEAAAPANVVQPSSKQRNAKHNVNRNLPTQTVLNYLRTQLPQQYALAEIVGKWIWLDCSPTRQRVLSNLLWTLGFHWNQRRGVWQHPCGSFNPYTPHPQDPRIKYGSYFAADIQPV